MKRLFTKTLSVILSVIMLLSVIPVMSASAAIIDGFYYRIANGKAFITEYTGSASVLNIPSTLGGYPVTGISDSAFLNCRSLTNVKIPDSVVSIGKDAFGLCANLKSITIPDNVTKIGDDAFRFCDNLASVTIPSSVTSIGHCAFVGCYSLTSVNVNSDNLYYSSENGILFNKNKTTLICYPNGKSEKTYYVPSSVLTIEGCAFYACNSLTSIIIPSSVTNIGDWAFLNCDSLTSIEIPSGVTDIKVNTFYSCDSLTSVTICDGVKNIGFSAFYACHKLTSVTIPSSITDIGEYAFCYCENLTSLTIPSSVTYIGDAAFEGCSKLTLYVKENSYAHQYAIDNKIPYSFVGGNVLDDNEKFLFLARNYPEYLNNAAENAYLGSCTKICYDVLEQYSDTHKGILAFAESFVNGTEIIIRNIASSFGLADSIQEEWLNKNATEYLRELSGCESVVYEGWKKVEQRYKDFKFSLKGIDLADDIQLGFAKNDFIDKLSVKSSCLSKAETQELADAIFKKQPNGIKNFFDTADYVVSGADLLLFSCQMLEVETYTLETLKDNISTSSPLYEAVCGSLAEIQDDPAGWVVKKYLSDSAVKITADLLDDFVNWSGDQVIKAITNNPDIKLSVTSALVKTTASLIYNYIYTGAKIDEIYGATVAYDFYTTVSSARTRLLTEMLQTKLNGGTPSDALIEDYRFMFEAKRVAMAHYANACLNINKEDGYDSLLESIKEESSSDGLLGFDHYIDACMATYLRDLEAGAVTCNHANCKYISTVKPTCTAQGYDKYVCNICGASFNKNFVAAKGHSYTSKITAPTCTTQGYTTYTCSCGNSYKSNYVASKGHSYSLYETVEPTYTTQGYDVFKCNNCGNTYKTNYTEVVAKSHTVTFKDQSDFGGEILATVIVDHGSAATAPTVAPEDGWEFYGWDTDFSNVTGDITVTAIRVNMNVQLMGLCDGWNIGNSKRMTYNSDGTSSKTVELEKGTYELKLYTEEWGIWLGNNNPVDDSCTDWHMSESSNNLVLNASGGLYTFTYTRDTGMLSIACTPVTSMVTASANSPAAGSVTVTNENVRIGDTTTITAMASEGYTFSKWSITGGVLGTDYKIVSGSTTSTSIEIQPLVKGKTIKATAMFLIKNYAVKFVDWDGTVLSTQIVEYGNSATAPNVPSRVGYTFSGWDSDFSNITESLVVTATYVKIPTGTLRVNVTGGTGFTISVDGSSAKPQGAVYRNSKLPIGATVAVVAKETANTTFIGWMNPATGIVLSADYEYTFTASGNDTINAVFSTQIEGVQVVTFKNDKSNRILDSQYYAAEDAISFPDAPTQVGYDFAGWSMTEAEIQAAIANGEDVTVLAIWTKALVPVEVAVVGGSGSGTYYANNQVTVTANEPETGKKFAYWTDAQGNIRSYNAEYTFFPSADTTVTAVFVDEDDVIDYQVLVSLDSIDTTSVADKNVFTYSWYCPDNYTFIKAGIVAVNKDNYNEATFVAGSSDSNVYDRSPNTANNIPVNTYTWTKSNVTSGQTWMARAYVQYRDANNNLVTVYSDIVEATKE